MQQNKCQILPLSQVWAQWQADFKANFGSKQSLNLKKQLVVLLYPSLLDSQKYQRPRIHLQGRQTLTISYFTGYLLLSSQQMIGHLLDPLNNIIQILLLEKGADADTHPTG